MEKFFEAFEKLWAQLWQYIYANVPFFKDIKG